MRFIHVGGSTPTILSFGHYENFVWTCMFIMLRTPFLLPVCMYNVILNGRWRLMYSKNCWSWRIEFGLIGKAFWLGTFHVGKVLTTRQPKSNYLILHTLTHLKAHTTQHTPHITNTNTNTISILIFCFSSYSLLPKYSSFSSLYSQKGPFSCMQQDPDLGFQKS